MKKKNLLVLSAVIIGIVILMLSLGWPPLSDKDASGAFTKAEKYKQNTLLDGDIIFNSELLSDTNLTKKTIRDLVQFGDFAIYLKTTLNQVWLPELEDFKGIPEINSAINQINEFSSFIENNNYTVQKLLTTLVEHHIDKNKPVNQDIESQLKQFYSYATQFLIRDSIFESTIGSIDLAVKGNQKKEKGIAALKDLRDRIVVDNFMYGFSVGDTSKITFSANQVLNSPQKVLKLFSFQNNLAGGLYATNFANIPGFANSWLKQLEIGGIPKAQVGNYGIVLDAVLGTLYGGMPITNSQNNTLGGAGLGAGGNGGNGAQALPAQALGGNGGNGGIGGNGGNGGLGNNNPILFMGGGTYFGLHSTNLGFIFNKEYLGVQLGNTQKGILAGNNVNLSFLLNTDNLKFVTNQDKSYQIEYTNANTIKAINQFQLGLYNQDTKGIIVLNFDKLNQFMNHNQVGSAQ